MGDDKAIDMGHVHSIDVDGVCQDCERLAGEGGQAVYKQGWDDALASLRALYQEHRDLPPEANAMFSMDEIYKVLDGEP